MDDLRKIKGTVAAILEFHPECRNSDLALYDEILKLKEFETGYPIRQMPIGQFLQSMQIYGCPKFESVRRARQKVQEQHPELRAESSVDAVRMEMSKEFRSFAMEGT